MTADEFRALVLDLEGVVEGAHMGHPDFRLHGRIFASLVKEDTQANLGLEPDAQAVLVAEAPATFAPAAGAWGRQGWTSVTLACADLTLVRGAIVMAWELARARPPARARTRRT